MAYQAALFDLDGTILDTAEDLRAAVEHALAQTGHSRAFPIAEVKALFGSGAKTAFVRALRLEKGAPLPSLEAVGTPADDTPAEVVTEAERALAVFREYYPAHCEIKTRPYPGVTRLLRALREAGVKTAVVSNKADAAVQLLCRDFFPGLYDVCVGETPAVRRKPAPDSVNAVLAALNVPRAAAVYVGDSDVDIRTAGNAGIPCVSVTWGFRSEAFLRTNGGTQFAGSAAELEAILRQMR